MTTPNFINNISTENDLLSFVVGSNKEYLREFILDRQFEILKEKVLKGEDISRINVYKENIERIKDFQNEKGKIILYCDKQQEEYADIIKLLRKAVEKGEHSIYLLTKDYEFLGGNIELLKRMGNILKIIPNPYNNVINLVYEDYLIVLNLNL